ncbi:nucleotidyltransferase domain-containing protein [Candidatus Woesearchaeota archaeon]|nr:nucleotidyltransferase domain-containing protein [Candidatus Woesearchaeota archaeon]
MKPLIQKKYLKLYEENAITRVYNLLFKYPEKEFSLSDIAREAGVAKANLGKILDELFKLEIITIEKLSKIWRVKANLQNWNYIKNKIVYNLNFIYNSGLVEFLGAHFNNPKSIILFGSFRKGEDISTSDIDIAIETEDTEYNTINLKELSVFEEYIHRNIQIHLFNRENINSNLFSNLVNGIILYGFLEVNNE